MTHGHSRTMVEMGNMQDNRDAAGLLSQPTYIGKSYIEERVDMHLSSREDSQESFVIREHWISIYVDTSVIPTGVGFGIFSEVPAFKSHPAASQVVVACCKGKYAH